MMRLFISYSHDDKAYAHNLCHAVRDRLYHDVWIDQRIVPAQDWWNTILTNIETCEALIYLMTPKSIESIYCRAELDYALALNKPILPIMLKSCKYPSELKRRRIQYTTIKENDVLLEVVFEVVQALTAITNELQHGRFHPPNPLPERPFEPTPERIREQVWEAYTLAEEAASENNYSLAERLFQKVIDADPLGMGMAAIERWDEISFERERSHEYARIRKMVETPALNKGAQPAWRTFIRKYGADYDPDGITSRFSTSHTAVSTSKKRPASEFLPAPFSWISIPASEPILEVSVKDKNATLSILPAFSISKYPITNSQFQVFITSPNGYANTSWWDYSPDAQLWREQHPEPRESAFKGSIRPRTNVTWYEAVAFTRWMSNLLTENVRLPSAQEWSFAAQGKVKRKYPWGNEWDSAKCNNSVDKDWTEGATTAVTQYEGLGDSPFGVVDMVGNVWEWTATAWLKGNSELTGSIRRTILGGSWGNSWKSHFDITTGSGNVPNYGVFLVGFRIARS